MSTRFLLALVLAVASAAQDPQPSEPSPTFESLLKKIASAPADPCDQLPANPGDWSDTESGIFDEADKAVVAKLNEKPGASLSQAWARATEALQQLERTSAEINKAWPEEDRFQSEVIEAPPGLLVKMAFRFRQTFTYFAMREYDDSGKPSGAWARIGASDDNRSSKGWRVGLDLTLLDGGQSKKSRFLAEFDEGGCAGASSGISYYAYEWTPDSDGLLDEFIKIEGSLSLMDDNHETQTKGKLIRLHYCWFSAVDTWDNPGLCTVDSYDLSGDHVRFLGSKYNLPDVVALANAIKYAEAHDYPATLAYCGSPEVARRMVRDLPPFVGMPRFDKDPNRPFRRISAAREAVDFDQFHFEVEKRTDRWLVVSFRMN